MFGIIPNYYFPIDISTVFLSQLQIDFQDDGVVGIFLEMGMYH